MTQHQSTTISKGNRHITFQMSVYSFPYNDLTINGYNCSKW